MKYLFLMAAAAASTAWGWAPVACPGSGSRMMTAWGERVTPENCWRDYPRPQMVREGWTNLNGLWDYAVTTNAAMTLGSPWAAYEPEPAVAKGKILVPFAIETPLSGVGRLLEPNELLWYRRTITVRKEKGKRLLLHFGAVDLRCQVFIGHREVTDVPHDEGNVPFTLDLTDYVQDGANELSLCVWDPTDGLFCGMSKQSMHPSGCMYTRLSGIWQTVWMESVPERHILGYRTTCDIAKGAVTLTFETAGEGEVEVSVAGAGKVRTVGKTATVTIPDAKLWSPKSPILYPFTATFGEDSVKGYFALRAFEKKRDANGIWRFFLNGEPVFPMGPLDQGWWPDGFLTPPSSDAIAFEIKTLKDMGLDMLRKHIKVEPAVYYHLCDKMGLMVFQDMPSGFGPTNQRYAMYRRELKSMVDALRVFPSIVMWIPYNEGWGQPGPFLTHATLDWVKRYDPTRLVNGPSGWNDYEGGLPNWRARISVHRPAGVCEAADVIDKHVYRGPGMFSTNDRRISFLGEFGGLGHAVEGHTWKPSSKSWGYGGTGDTATREGLEKAYLGLMDALAGLAGRGLSGSVYTQTTDVEIEINGYMTYDRKVLKYDVAKLRAAHERVKAVADYAARNRLTTTCLFPKRDADAKAWAYAFAEPGAGWEQPGFDDAAWKRGPAGFGGSNIERDHANAKWKTQWTTPTLFLRRHFTATKRGRLFAAAIDLFHDEDVTVYLNGKEIFSRKGFLCAYQAFALDTAAFEAALKEGDNVLAVKVIQTTGGQFFDCGLDMTRGK